MCMRFILILKRQLMVLTSLYNHVNTSYFILANPFHVMLIPSLSSCNFANLLSLVMCADGGKHEALKSISTCGQTAIFRALLCKTGVLWE